jgi:hypothetical protein
MLSTLVSKSLIRRSGAERYDQHEMVRQYAADRFQDNEKEEILARDLHSDYYTTYLQQAEPRLKSKQQRSAIADLSSDVDNLRLAWTWAVSRHKVGEFRKATRCLQWFFDLRGWLPEVSSMWK